MCLIIDMNVFPCVFDSNNMKHKNFKPVKDWILTGKGKMVVGGSTYFSELAMLGKYMKLYNQLKSAGKVIVADPQKDIDDLEEKLKSQLVDKDFDDPHLVALLIFSGCQIICSNDSRAFPFFKRKEWYPKGRNTPKIYCESSLSRCNKILNDTNISAICLPCDKLNKAHIQNIEYIKI